MSQSLNYVDINFKTVKYIVPNPCTALIITTLGMQYTLAQITIDIKVKKNEAIKNVNNKLIFLEIIY